MSEGQPGKISEVECSRGNVLRGCLDIVPEWKKKNLVTLVAGGWLASAYRGLCPQSQTYQVHNTGEGVIFSVDLHQCSSIHNELVVSATSLSVSYIWSVTCISIFILTLAVSMLGHLLLCGCVIDDWRRECFIGRL